MADEAVGLVDEGAGLSQIGRLVNTFVAPEKTFADIRRSASWWLPVIFASVIGLVFVYVVMHKIGMAGLVDGIVRQNSMLEDRLASATPADAAVIRGSIEKQLNFMWVGPVLVVVIGLLVSLLFFATAGFGFGGKATYSQVLAVWFYGTLPLVFISLLTIVVLYAGVGGESFNVKNTVGTNIGYYLQDGDSPHWLVTLLGSVDVFAIWSAVLLSIGLSVVSGIKRGAAAAVVFGWWAIWVLLQTGLSAFTG